PDTVDAPRVPARPRRWRKPILTILVVLAVAFMGYGYLIYRAEKRLQAALAEADLLDPGWRLADLEAARPPVSDEENSVLQMAVVRQLLPNPWSAAIDKAFEESPPPEAQLTPEQIAVLKAEMPKLLPALQEARKLANFSRARSGIPWDENLI